MKKIAFIIISFILSVSAPSAQECKTPWFEIAASYGLGYNPFTKLFSDGDVLNLNIPKTGSFMELNLDYRLPHNRYIGIGYGRLQNSGTITDGFQMTPYDINFILYEYRHAITKHLFDLHFRFCFKYNMHLTLGAYYFFESQNTYEIFGRSDDGETVTGVDFVFYNEKLDRWDNFGLFGSYEYYYPIANYLDIGIKAKVYLSLNGVEAAGLLPTLKVRF